MRASRTLYPIAALTLWLVALAVVRPLSVDESQYVAATSLTAHGLIPYRDFAYLQTPLQPIVFTPLEWLFAGHLLLALRFANALLGVVTVAMTYATARRLGATPRASLIAAGLLVTCESFAWCVGVARNDMLPASLFAFGIWLIAGRSGGFAAGIAFGLAASAKISYAVPAATVFVAQVWTADVDERRRSMRFAAGVATGLLPTICLAALAPRQFLTEAIVFPAAAPTQFYTDVGTAWRLGPLRFIQLLQAAAIGPALIAAVEVMRNRRRWFGEPTHRAMLAASFGGLVSAALNKPFQIFYLLPALPPLFVLVGLYFSASDRRPRWLSAMWAAFVFVGLVPVAAWFLRAENHGIAPAIDVERRSAHLAAALHDQQVIGPVATLAGQYVRNVDPRFAAGPFLYRTRYFVSADQARNWHIATRDRPEVLAASPPAAFVTGTYPDVQPAIELQLTEEAKALGYRRVRAGEFTIWLPPNR